MLTDISTTAAFPAFADMPRKGTFPLAGAFALRPFPGLRTDHRSPLRVRFPIRSPSTWGSSVDGRPRDSSTLNGWPSPFPRGASLAAACKLSGLLNTSCKIDLSARNAIELVLSWSLGTSPHVPTAEAEKMDFLPKDRSEVSASAQLMLRDYAGQRWPSGNHKFRMTRLAGVLGLSFRRVRSIYQGDPAVRLRADEMAAIEALRNAEAEEANRAEFTALEDRVARLEAALFAIDEEFHSPQVAGFRQATNGGRREDVTGATFADIDQTD